MSMRSIVKDSVDQSVVIRIIDSTTGLPETAVEHNTAGIDLWYRREGALQTSITEAALAALDSAHTDGGIESMGHGYYRLDLPDAAVATGVNGVMVGGTVTGMIVIGCYVPLIDALLTAAGIVNEWETQSQADPTGFHVNAMEWLSQPVTLSTGNKPDVNINEISDDSGAADTLESQFDGTGIAGDTYPSTQSQLAGIANVGSAVHTPAASYTLTTGTQSSGTITSTQALDGTNHEHTDAAGAMDLYYEFSIGSGIPTGFTVTGYLNGNNDDLEVYAYDWVAAGWVQVGELNGKAASTNEVYSYDLFVNMVGSGANMGTVRVRFTDGAFTLSTATLAIDQIFLSFSRGSEGYENGAIWIDTGAGNTDTVVGVDGTARNPVSTMAAANTLAASTNLNTFHIAAGSTITFAASQDNQMFHGMNWTLALGGQSISGTHINGAAVSGICTGASRPKFTDCHFGATTLPPSHLTDCGFENTITAGSAGNFSVDRCHAMGSPIFDFGGGLNSSDVNFSGWSGSIEIQNMGAGSGTYTMALDGNGELTINNNCSETSNLSLDGNFRVTDNASGAVTVTTDDDTTRITATLADTAEMQPKLPTNFIMGSSDQTDKDDEIDAIKAATDNLPGDPASETNVDANETKIDAVKAVTDLLPDAGALDDLATLVGRLTAARAGYLDELAAANLPADVDTLLGRLTAVRAGYLDELAAANLPADVDGIKAVTDLLPDAGALDDLATLVARLTAARAGYLDELAAANLPADIDTLLARLTAARAGYLDELAAANIPADVDQVIADIAALNNVSAAQVNAEVLDVLNVDTFGEPGQGAPPATTTLQLKLAYLFKAFRNKIETTATEARIFNDAGAVVDQKASVSDNGTTFTRGEFVSGP